MNLKTLLVASLALSLCGCATVQENYKKYDHGRDYMKQDKYQDEPIVVPQKFSKNKIEDYYPVPQIPQVSSNEPSLDPPSNSMKEEKVA